MKQFIIITIFSLFLTLSTEDMNFLVVDRKGEGDNLVIHNLEKENITINFQL